MNSKEKAKLIRTGNKLFNKGDIEKAKDYFVKAQYSDGIRRIADYYFYDKKDILRSLPLYIKCKNKKHIEESYKRIAASIQVWIKQDHKDTTDTSKLKPTLDKIDDKQNKEIEPKKTSTLPIKKSMTVEEQIKKQLLQKKQNTDKSDL